VRRIYRRALKYEGKGEWEKVLRRIYRLAGLLKVRLLRSRAMSDLLNAPSLADRICDYMRCSGTTAHYLRFVLGIIAHEEQIYPDVDLVAFESLLRVEATDTNARAIRRLASEVLLESSPRWKRNSFRAPAALLILRFGDRRSLSRLRSAVATAAKREIVEPEARAAAIVYSSFGVDQFLFVRKVAARQMRNPLAEVVRLIEAIRSFVEIPNRYKNRLRLNFDSVRGVKFLDMRTLLMARLLVLSKRENVRVALRQWARANAEKQLSVFDKRMIRRLLLN
jgi:hypothetical protein